MFIGKPDLFVELCAGSASVSLQLLGGRQVKPPASYVGAKTRYAAEILNLMGLDAGVGARQLLLVDPGEWGMAWKTLSNPTACNTVASVLLKFRGWDDRWIWHLCQQLLESRKETERCAAFVWLQSRSLRNLPVDQRGKYTGPQMPSGDVSDPYKGRRVPTTIGTVKKVQALTTLPWPKTDVLQVQAEEIKPHVFGNTFVYIDPPYEHTLGYQHQFPREMVMKVATAWKEAGATVAVSEDEPLPLNGWQHHQLTGTDIEKRTFTRSKEEWVTFYRNYTPNPHVNPNLEESVQK
jgi:hypothetical protein